MYAKYIDENTVKYPPRILKGADFICFNFDKASPEIMRSKGYVELVEDEKPEAQEGYYLKPTYTLHEDKKTETVEETITDEEGNEQTVEKEVVTDNSYIQVSWTVEEIVEEEE